MAEATGLNQAVAGRYVLLALIGRGGMGAVWRARDEVLDREVAVKEVLIHEGLSDRDREILHERTKREAQATARLNHPGIVTVHDVVEEDGRPWIVMELVPARSLQEILDSEGPLPYQQAAELGRQTLSALRVAHAAGITHRDIKPANVLVLRDDSDHPGGQGLRVIITDFGLAQRSGDVTLTQTGLVMGSPAYIAPERARGEKADAAADLWALGATLYAATEGRPPHDRAEAMAALAAVLIEDPKPPQNAGPLTDVIMGLLERDREQRLSAEAAADLLSRVGTGSDSANGHRTEALGYGPGSPRDAQVAERAAPSTLASPLPGGGGGAAAGVESVPVRPAESPKRRRLGAALVAAAVLVAGIGAGGFFYLDGKSGSSSARQPGTSAAPLGQQKQLPSHKRASPTTTRHPIPPGLVRANGVGFSFGVPPGWRYEDRNGTYYWRDPASPAYVQVDKIPWTGTPIAHWKAWQNEVVKNRRLKNFTPLGIGDSFQEDGYQSADNEFTWTANGMIMHALDRGMVTPSGRHYAVMVAYPETQWSAHRVEVQNILATFRPI